MSKSVHSPLFRVTFDDRVVPLFPSSLVRVVPSSFPDQSVVGFLLDPFSWSVLSSPSSLLQSDVIHQSVYELIHSEDRVELQKQLSLLLATGGSSAGAISAATAATRMSQHDSFPSGKITIPWNWTARVLTAACRILNWSWNTDWKTKKSYR